MLLQLLSLSTTLTTLINNNNFYVGLGCTVRRILFVAMGTAHRWREEACRAAGWQEDTAEEERREGEVHGSQLQRGRGEGGREGGGEGRREGGRGGREGRERDRGREGGKEEGRERVMGKRECEWQDATST